MTKIVFVFLFLVSSLVFAAKNPTQFMSLTDIHFDPFTTCTKEITPCPIIEKLQNSSVDQWDTILTTNDTLPPKYKQDTNYTLLKSALLQCQKTARLTHPRFVIVLGDFLGHDFRQHYDFYSSDKTQQGYQSFVKKTLEFLAQKIAVTFPTIDVYTAVGNNDSYQDDYFSDPNGDFFNDMASTWSRLIKDKNNQKTMKKEFPTGGYYAIDFPSEPRFRLIVLNSVLFSNKSQGTSVDIAAEQELNWLHDELQSVRRQHQIALIAMHIPAGVDVFASLKNTPFTVVSLWKPVYTQRFQEELQAYANNIIAILPAHFHMDEFQVLSMENVKSIPVIFTPAISPLFGNNPGFKVYRYSHRSHQLTDFVTYTNALSTTQTWNKEYDFNTLYQPDCANCSLIDGMNRLQKTGDLANYFMTYFSGGTTSQPITTKWLPYYWCDIHTIIPVDYQNCIDAE